MVILKKSHSCLVSCRSLAFMGQCPFPDSASTLSWTGFVWPNILASPGFTVWSDRYTANEISERKAFPNGENTRGRWRIRIWEAVIKYKSEIQDYSSAKHDDINGADVLDGDWEVGETETRAVASNRGAGAHFSTSILQIKGWLVANLCDWLRVCILVQIVKAKHSCGISFRLGLVSTDGQKKWRLNVGARPSRVGKPRASARCFTKPNVVTSQRFAVTASADFRRLNR